MRRASKSRLTLFCLRHVYYSFVPCGNVGMQMCYVCGHFKSASKLCVILVCVFGCLEDGARIFKRTIQSHRAIQPNTKQT